MFARPGLCGIGVGRLGLVAASRPGLVAQALAILAKYGAAANLYLPGVGAVSGITAGNWLDTVGGTPATVDGAVGTVVNARGGVNLVQGTPSNRPILRLSGGVYSWQLNGSNHRFELPIVIGDESWVCAGVTFNGANSGIEGVISTGGGSAPSRGFALSRYVAANRLALVSSNGSVLTTTTYDHTSPINTGIPFVVEGCISASFQFCGLNGKLSSQTSRSGSVQPQAQATALVGSWGAGFYLNGRVFPLCVINAETTAQDRATLRQFIASLSGVTL